MKKPLKKFYAVTETSIYLVSMTEDCKPWVEKIFLMDNRCSPVKKGSTLKHGSKVSIGRTIIMFSPHNEYQKDIGGIDDRLWGGHTSAVIALFLNKKKAVACAKSDCFHSPCDRRWLDETKAVLDRIGGSHPVFSITQFNHLRLLTPDKKEKEKPSPLGDIPF
ncbi:MAG: hypothetical protein WCO30_00830 [bacterium]